MSTHAPSIESSNNEGCALEIVDGKLSVTLGRSVSRYGDDGRLALTPAKRRALDHAKTAEETLDYHDHQPAGDES